MRSRYLYIVSFSLLILLSCNSAQAQLKKVWDKTYGGSKPEDLRSIIEVDSGNFILTGSSASPASFDKTDYCRGQYDFWVVKIKPDGTKIWDKTFGGLSREDPYSVIQTKNGASLILGRSNSLPGYEKTSPNYGGYDYWLLKIDRNGNKVWDRTYGGDGNDVGDGVTSHSMKIIIAPDGNYLIAGSSGSSISGNKATPNKGSNFNVWLIKIDTNGNKLWEKTFGGGYLDTVWGYSKFTDIISIPENGYLVASTSGQPKGFDKSDSSRGYEDFWLIKIDDAGNKQWDRIYGGSDRDILESICKSEDGGFLLAGSSMSAPSFEKSTPNKGNLDYWVVKIDENGNKQWDKTFGGNGDDRLRGGISIAHGGYYLCGTSYSQISFDKTVDIVSEGWILKIDEYGNKLADYILDSSYRLSDLYDVFATSDKKFFFGGTMITGVGHREDYWVIKAGDTFIKIPKQRYCIPDTLEITAFYYYQLIDTSNTYLFQMSDSAGSFASPYLLGSMHTAGDSVVLKTLLPDNIPGSAKYRVRVIMTAPADTIYAYSNLIIGHTPPDDSVFLSRNVLCDLQDSIKISTIPGYHYQWIYNDSINTDTLFFCYAVRAGSYKVRLTDDYGCSVMTPDTEVMLQLPSVLINYSDTSICKNEMILINAKNSLYNQYLWSTGDTTSFIKVKIQGNYVVKATNGTCTSIDTVNVHQYPNLSLALPADSVVCLEELKSIILDAGVYKSYYWYPTGERSQSIYATKAETYIVIVTDSNNCNGSDTTLISDECLNNIFIPNAFTPNNDGINDMFRAYGKNIQLFEMKIYNRWGEELFSSNDNYSGWDGNYNSKPCTGEVYFFTITYQLNGKPTQTTKGNLTLLR